MSMRDEQARFFGKLAALMEGGVPMLGACEVAARGVGIAAFRAALDRILTRAYGGASLTDSIEEEGALFSPEVVCLLRHGEQAGDIDRKARAVGEGLRDGVFDPGRLDEDSEGDPLTDLLDEAVAAEATAVHVEPRDGGARARLRVEGRLEDHEELSHAEAGVLLVLAKRRGGLDATRVRSAQAGSFEYAGRVVRVATCPYSGGEGLTLRLLVPERDLALGSLGAPDAFVREMRGWLAAGNGFVLVAGPASSGRTTTIAALLAELDRTVAKVSVIDREEEVRLPGVGRVRARPEEGFGYEEALRAQLGLDLDAVALAEVPSARAVRLAASVALSGHLVIAGVYARGAPEALVKLLEAGLDADTAAESIRGIVAQRLLRAKAGGRRVPVFEVLTVTPEMRKALRSGGDLAHLRRTAEHQGMTNLRDAAQALVDAGEVDAEEAERVLG